MSADQHRPPGGELAEVLRGLLERARWFGGKGRPFDVVGVHRLGTLSDPEGQDPQVSIDAVTVRYAEQPGQPAETERYQVPMAFYRDRQDRLEHASLGIWEDTEHGWAHVYDAVHDRVSMARWLNAFAATPAAEGAEYGTDGEEDRATGEAERPADRLRFHRLPGHELDTGTHSTLFSGEQSNSSVAFGEDSLMKVFRKVTAGVNPDVEIHEVLTRAGSEHVAALYGWLDVPDEESGSVLQLAMLQQFLRTASDGWDLAQASVRNLFAEGDLHADEVGGDFAAEAARLGEALAEVHQSLAEHFPTHRLSAREMSALGDAMQERLQAAIRVAPEIAEYEKPLTAAYDALGGLDGIEVQRIHGDLHLGQTLRTVKNWKIVDFEGEPAKLLAERVLPDSRWRDVAGMLRSFDYAPRVAERSFGEGDPDGATQRAYRAAEWAARNQEAFLDAYAGRPLAEQEQVLLAAYVADKAIYETVYEARNRPTWVSIPLAALARIGAP